MRCQKSETLIWFKEATVNIHFVKNKEKEMKKKKEKGKSFAPYYSRDLIVTEVELCEWIQSIQVFYNSEEVSGKV